ncbi:hypothetical protein E4U57_002701 [Claviceps arundinis]|uniref:IdtS n=1 Tax=Claviceps arundinis TaxID=1623583 RepID=A0A9P7SM57_9HYPO|nr:hypothetical protein E4U57_002701 [Claviceps arundinis]KAG5963830.1 hypothetical protein E4U56_002572 [Claviceps arundinis]UGT01672.1 IdtS [Claviceps arundinis]UGT01714.1 IdtS [Claviceps arundinis]
MAPSIRSSFSFLQVLLILAGMVWKAYEGFAIIDYFDHATGHARHEAANCSWYELCIFASMSSWWKNWPWFALHLFLYTSQLAGLSAIILCEAVPQGGFLRRLGIFVASTYLTRLLGLSTALPTISLWILHRHRRTKTTVGPTTSLRHGPEHDTFLRRIFWFSALTHIGSFLVAVTAALTVGDRSPWHLTNTLLGVPDCSQLPCSQIAQRYARLRQINEMTGTSSGFFLTAGIFYQALTADKFRKGAQLLIRMFFVSLIAGPAAGGADVLLLRNLFITSSVKTPAT